jgi:hypothetical protein
MITFLVAWINAKYKAGYELIFVGTVIVDLAIIFAVAEAFKR